MDKKEAREAAYDWIEKTFIDKLASGDVASDKDYNLAFEMGFSEYAIDLDYCALKHCFLAEEIDMSFRDIKISFDKKSRNSGIVYFKMRTFDQEKMELVLEVYENILQLHRLDDTIIYESARATLNGGWFIYDCSDKHFWCFTPGFYVFDRKIESNTGSFRIEVSLTNFESMDKYDAIIHVKNTYTPEITQRFREEFNL